MPDTLLTLLVVTVAVTALPTGPLLVAPRVEARKKRLGDVHAARDAFRTHMSRIASARAGSASWQAVWFRQPSHRCSSTTRRSSGCCGAIPRR
ncbi:hypothetical protein DMH18_16225 [Streptomyces sp. WAC 06783]|nr:hypothetical protein DMH18_16225 [Streptomyces sp. WAC 06783]